MKKVCEVEGCINCPMAKLFPNNNFVPAQVGPRDLLLIGESPGENESLTGRPFSGGAGKWLDSALRNAHIRRDDINVINVIQCRPPENVFPTTSEARSYISKADSFEAVNHCIAHHVKPFILSRGWDKIVLLGDKALYFLGQLKGGIFKWRGSPIDIEIGEKKFRAIGTLHPAYIMRDQIMFPVMVNDLQKSLDPPPEHYITHPTMEDVQTLVTDGTLTFDIETYGFSKRISMIGLCPKPYHAIVPPFEGGYVEGVRGLFRVADNIVGHNCIQFDLPILEANHVSPAPDAEIWDTMLMHHLLFPQFSGELQKKDEDLARKTSGGHGLEFLNSQFTSKPSWKHGKGEDEELYCARDTDVTRQCYEILRPMLKRENLEDVYKYVQVPLAKICHLMHETGFKIEPSRLDSIRTKYLAEMRDLEEQLSPSLRTQNITVRKRTPAPPGTLGKSGKPVKFVMMEQEEETVPWRSNEVLKQYLYDELGLPIQHHIKTDEPTVDKGALEKLHRRLIQGGIKHAKAEEIAKELNGLRKIKKLSTLISGFVKSDITTVDRLHPHFNVHGTVSGRLSSSDPNLQNIPEAARYIYVPSYPDWCLVEVDYSSIENRLTALFANDQERLNRWLADPDFNEHKWTASMFFDIPYEQVEKDNDKDAPYGRAKRINHGSNYGMGPKKISNMYDMNFYEVRELTEKWKEVNKVTVDWQSATAAKAKADGVLTTPFGRKRYFYTQSYYTEALSFLPQSTAADVIYRAMIGLMYERVGWPLEKVLKVVSQPYPLPMPARLLIQVHDSLVFECPAALVDELIVVVKQVMEQPWAELGGFRIPIGIFTGEPGASWGELTKYV